MKASWGTSTRPTIFMRFLPSFCFSSSLRLRRDVAAVALGQDVLADGADGFAGNDARADGCLDRHLELLAGNQFAQLLGHHEPVGVGLVAVGDGAERVDLFALEQDVDLDQVGDLFAVGLPVQRGVAAGLGLEHVEEVEDDLGQRKPVADLHAFLGEVVHAAHDAAAGLAQFHDGADEFVRRQDRGRRPWARGPRGSSRRGIRSGWSRCAASCHRS